MKRSCFLSLGMLRAAWAGLLSLALIACVFASALPAAAQSAPATPSAPYPVPATITVTGTGTISVTPDIAHVTAGVTITEPTLSSAQQRANDIAQALLDVATKNEVPDADVQTSTYSVTVIEAYDDNGNPTGERAFQVSNILTLTIRDLDAVGGILDQMVDAGANVVYGISFDVSDPGPAVSEARTAATTDARTRAEAYAAGLDVEIVGIQSVTEQSAPTPAARYDSSASYDVAAASESVAVAAGSTELVVTVEVVFLIGA